LTLDFSFDKSKGDNRKELVVVGKEKKNPKILHDWERILGECVQLMIKINPEN